MAKQRRHRAGRALLTLTGIGVGVGLVLANRDKLPANIREFNKRFTNPMMTRSIAAGKRGNLGLIIHRGRTSGREYTTPVRIDAIPGGFLVPMPYGTDTDWLKNILAAQGALLRFQGHDITVDQPEIIDAATGLAMLSPSSARVARLMGIKHYLRLRQADLPTHLSDEEPIAEDRPAH
jgi:hypothetical protein